MRYQVETFSAIDGRRLVMGGGETKASAWEDAVGPKPWTSYQKTVAKKYWIVETATSPVDRFLPEPRDYNDAEGVTTMADLA
jgi:hypothetical protein